MRGLIPLFPNVFCHFIESCGVEFTEISQQILEDYFIPQIDILKLFKFELHKLCSMTTRLNI